MDGLPHLPGDIVNSIFFKLPVKSLSRFKSCYKSWHCCIDDTDFIKSHLHKSSIDISRQKFVFVNLILHTGTHKFEIVSTGALSINADSKVVSIFMQWLDLCDVIRSWLSYDIIQSKIQTHSKIVVRNLQYLVLPMIILHYLINRYFINNYVEVYSVKNQCWRAIDNIFLLYQCKGQVSLNGVIHRTGQIT
ncbi:hypothetical protein H5410_006180 [Solanum commersonii]|uniref:F-box domain-containing protein n=1 Tax=Solanum commersonii TaxID=4109 RepID=A0A9J6A9N8_SOLCO|nr:hypothetical protein H5410_006180 [Solanum commersonii]